MQIKGHRPPQARGQPQPVELHISELRKLQIFSYTYLCQLPLVLLHQLWVNFHFGGLECWRSDELEGGVAGNNKVSHL